MENRTAVSLFSGCGGLDIGFHRLGYGIVYAADSDKKAVLAYNRNLQSVAEHRDLTEGVATDVIRMKPECVFAGPPCQGFSTAGKRNPDDPRSSLLLQAGRLALLFRPKVIVIENVPGVRIGIAADYWKALLQLFRQASYQTYDVICDARDLGLAQSRRRVFLFAWNTGRAFPDLPRPRNAKKLNEVLSKVESLTDHRPQHLLPDSRLFRIARRIGPGQKLCNVRAGERSVHTWHIPEVFGATSAKERHLLESLMRLRRKERTREWGDADPVSIERLTRECGSYTTKAVERLKLAGYIKEKNGGLDLTHTFNGKFRRLRWEDEAFTVDTRFGDPRLFLHPNEHRPFSVREAARIQGFPDTYAIDSDDRHWYRLIGNAVPPAMGAFAAHIALRLAS